jgi:succinyldiaminopimelate transaminase
VFDRLPEYPWEQLKPFAQKARQHSGGMVDLSIGSPVDPTPKIIQDALSAAASSPGYPSTGGSAELKDAVVEWSARRRGVAGLAPEQVMPSIGSKELISFLPLLLGLGKGDVVVQPKVAYTAYVVGAALVDAEIVSEDDPAIWPANTKLVWINSPGNPDGRVLDVEQMKAAVDRARELGAVLASDECYAELGWDDWSDKLIPSVLDSRVCGGDHSSLLALYSLSKQSNMAGHRAAFAAGDAKLVKSLVNIRMHAGLNTPAPVQHAIAVALGDYTHVAAEKEIYRNRREQLLGAVRDYGFELSDSEAGLYLWATLHEDCWKTVDRMAELGILVGPGSLYGDSSTQHVRFALTATDENISLAVARLRDAIGLKHR